MSDFWPEDYGYGDLEVWPFDYVEHPLDTDDEIEEMEEAA